MAFPFVHYAITINGAKVSDTRTGQAVLRAEIALDTCLRLLDLSDVMTRCMTAIGMTPVGRSVVSGAGALL